MSHVDDNTSVGSDDRDTSSRRVVAAAIRDAIEALEPERPDLAARLRELIEELHEDCTS